MLHPSIVVKYMSSIHEKGLFASENIEKNTPIWKLTDRVYTFEEIQRQSDKFRDHFDIYGFQCGENLFSNPQGICKYANHSCDPNTYWKGSTVICLAKDVVKDEEITYDYSTCDIDIEMSMKCQCGSKNCRKTITNKDYLISSWQHMHGQRLPLHTLKAIKLSRMN